MVEYIREYESKDPKIDLTSSRLKESKVQFTLQYSKWSGKPAVFTATYDNHSQLRMGQISY